MAEENQPNVIYEVPFIQQNALHQIKTEQTRKQDYFKHSSFHFLYPLHPLFQTSVVKILNIGECNMKGLNERRKHDFVTSKTPELAINASKYVQS